jgi:UDP-2,3-diacylglucosamine pyrophosphatase LpxH
MNDKKITLIISDTHIGAADASDDHVYNNDQLTKFIRKMSESTEGRKGDIELFINGDFFEFAQVLPEAYTLNSSTAWCSETESLLKLEEIIKGHSDIFEALKYFQETGNAVTIAAGNHDVDLYWQKVQKRIRDKAGAVRFELGKDLCTRHDGRLLIGHGHHLDVANAFKRWDDPFVDFGGEKRLEMCPGTLFMVKFVNWLEAEYPFSDNMIPVTALARLLLKEDKKSFVAMAWTLFKFVGRNPLTALSSDKTDSVMPDIGSLIRNRSNDNEEFLERMNALHKEATGEAENPKSWASGEVNDKAKDFLMDLLVNLPPEKWEDAFEELGSSGTLSSGGDGKTLSILRAGMAHDKEELKQAALVLLAERNAEVAVFGHTHQPDEYRGKNGDWDGGYFNPGSWTRYVDVSKMVDLKLADLADEKDFPYQLNYIRVELGASDALRADKLCFEEENGKRFSL